MLGSRSPARQKILIATLDSLSFWGPSLTLRPYGILGGFMRSLISAVVLSIALTAGFVLATGPAAQADTFRSADRASTSSDYVRENSVSYPLKTPFGTVSTACSGWAWIGQTYSNYIEVFTRISCSFDAQFPAVEVWIKRSPSDVGSIAHNSNSATHGSYISTSTSHAGSSGQFCVHGYSQYYTGVWYSGFGIACIWT